MPPRLSVRTIRQLEQAIRVAPQDLEVRELLLRHYFDSFFILGPRPLRRLVQNVVITLTRLTGGFFVPPAVAKHTEHVVWLIANPAESNVAGLVAMRIYREIDPRGVVRAQELWNTTLSRCPSDLKVLKNAANFFAVVTPSFAEELLAKGAELEPDNLEWQSLSARVRTAQSSSELSCIMFLTAKQRFRRQKALSRDDFEAIQSAEEELASLQQKLYLLDDDA